MTLLLSYSLAAGFYIIIFILLFWDNVKITALMSLKSSWLFWIQHIYVLLILLLLSHKDLKLRPVNWRSPQSTLESNLTHVTRPYRFQVSTFSRNCLISTIETEKHLTILIVEEKLPCSSLNQLQQTPKTLLHLGLLCTPLTSCLGDTPVTSLHTTEMPHMEHLGRSWLYMNMLQVFFRTSSKDMQMNALLSLKLLAMVQHGQNESLPLKQWNAFSINVNYIISLSSHLSDL